MVEVGAGRTSERSREGGREPLDAGDARAWGCARCARATAKVVLECAAVQQEARGGWSGERDEVERLARVNSERRKVNSSHLSNRGLRYCVVLRIYSRADRASPGCTRGERGRGCGVCASPRPPAFAPPRLVSVSRSTPAPLSHSAAMVSLRLNTSPRVPSFSGPMALATALLCVPRPARLSSPPRRHLRPDDLALSTSLTLPALVCSVVSIFSEPYWSVSPRCGPSPPRPPRDITSKRVPPRLASSPSPSGPKPSCRTRADSHPSRSCTRAQAELLHHPGQGAQHDHQARRLGCLHQVPCASPAALARPARCVC